MHQLVCETPDLGIEQGLVLVVFSEGRAGVWPVSAFEVSESGRADTDIRFLS